MCASYGLGGGGREGDPLPDDPDLAPLDERVTLSFDFHDGWVSRVQGRRTLTGRNARNLNPMLRHDGEDVVLESAWFKLWPGGRFDSKAKTFNARAENLPTKWRSTFIGSRGLVPADWFNEKGHEFATSDRAPFMIATVWNRVHDEETGDELTTYALVTRPSSGAVARFNERMPLLLPPQFWQTWLDPHETGTRELAETAVAASTELSERTVLLYPPQTAPTLF